MTQSQKGVPPSSVKEPNRVVISGMSGLYPKSRYIRDLENVLYNKINPITTDNVRWKYSHPEVAQYAGSVPDIDRFDAQFFKVHYLLGIAMDSMARKIMELAYEAIYDAGVNPKDISGKKVGVYIGTCFSESEKVGFYLANSRTGFGIPGCNKSMFANRISYWLNAKGPSYSIDNACCSSTVALEQAYLAILRGECEAAIVGGANLCLHPQSSVHFGRIMNLSSDGKTKSFSQDASGCVRTEAINVLFLQKAKDALRIYANVLNVKCEYLKIAKGETRPKYGFYRDPEDTAKFLKTFYDRSGISSDSIEYIEGFGSAVPEADKSELQAFDKVFCTNRDAPLMVGSVMSNIGYGEAASGISAITKVLLGYHRGELAGNLNCETPRRDVAAIEEGRIRVLNENQPFQRSYAAVNSMSVTGVNAHVLLHGDYKPKDFNRYKSNIPHLVTISGRQDSSVHKAFDELKSNAIDPEQLALLQNIHQTEIVGHLGRGYTILDTKDGKTVSLSEKVDYFDDAQRPLWFVYSGMGSQWAGMGTQLMQFSIFAAAIERCRRVLEPKGLDIIHILTSPEKTTFDNILHSFVGITAVQIGLTDLLRELGLVPDNIIGHSVGELGCAYADGCLTAEETILSAYSRGKVSLETTFIKGSMAAVGIGFQKASKLCPPEIEIACHNSAESCTISGPAEAMQAFVTELVAKGIFAKEVPCSNIAFHSRYIADAGAGLLKCLIEIIKTPKARSDKWISTSVPQNRWDEKLAKYSSAEYHTNNLLSPVLFEEASKLIPSNAVLVEIAPHGLLQAILKRALPETCTNIPLTRRGHPDSSRMILEAIGELYMVGLYPKVQVLYPEVKFPVSTGTPFLSHLVDWAHGETWPVPLCISADRGLAASCKFLISEHDDRHSFLKGHVFRKKMHLPFSYALVAVWDTLAMSLKVPKKKLNVVFSDVHLHAQTVLHDQHRIQLVVSLQKGSGQFEIMDDNFKVATGFINSDDDDDSILNPDVHDLNEDNFVLNSRDVYQLFNEKEYMYSGQFRSIHSTNDTFSKAYIVWDDNWVTFIDGLLQLNIIKNLHNAVSVPSVIRRMAINVTEHLKHININDDDVAVVRAHVSDVNDLTSCGGVLIENLKLHDIPPAIVKQIEFNVLRFVPWFESNIDVFTSLQVLTQIVAGNINKDIINITGIEPQNKNAAIFDYMKSDILSNIPGIKIVYKTIIKNNMSESFENSVQTADLILILNLSNDDEFIQLLQRSSRKDVFIINQTVNTSTKIKTNDTFEVVSVLTDEMKNTRLELLRYKPTTPAASTSVVVRSERDLPNLIAARSKLLPRNSLIIISTYPPFSGLRRLVKHWRKDSTRNSIHLVMVNNTKDVKHLAKTPCLLAYSILDNSVWGGEYYLPLEENVENENVNKAILQSEVIGDLESLEWVEAPAVTTSGVSVKVHYAGINRNDVLRASGVIPTKSHDIGYGMEFSGVTESGERVMGLVPVGAVQSHVIAQPELMWPVPSYWSLEDAATVPLAYVYAYYCLEIKREPSLLSYNNCSVLIHGGAGALGQAMISVCLHKGYRVFTTVSELHKKKFLLALFPKLKEEDIGYSRDTSFADLVINATSGKGCRIVVCCLKGELKNMSLKCSSSVLYDTVGLHSQEIFNFGLNYLNNERNYVQVDISSIFHSKAEEVKRLQMLVYEGIVSGAVRPLSRVTYAPQHVTRAFRLLAASRHRGRVLIHLQDQHPVVKPSFSCSEEGCHIIFCDAQPLGLQLADMLIRTGAKKIHLHFAEPPHLLGYLQRLWNKQNVQVSVSSEDLNVKNNFSNLFQTAMSLGSIEGVYLAAEKLLGNTTLRTLDSTIRNNCPSLKNFMMFSNGDNAGQLLAVERAKDGLPGTSVDMSMLERVVDVDGSTWYPSIKEVAERALLSSHPVLLTQLKRVPRESLIQRIAALSDVTITEETDDRTTLAELGFRPEMSQAVSSYLKNEHSIFVDESDIPLLSLESIKQTEERFTDINFEDVKGLESFFSFVDTNELEATTDLVFMPTLIHNSLSGHEFDASEIFLSIVPGLEGHYQRFSSLCEQLKLPALVLQPGLDHLHETVQELALRYSKVVLKRSHKQKSFYILGFETGTTVALELAAILELQGQTGTVFCLGDGPDEIKSLIKEQLREYSNEEALQIGLVQHMFSLMTGTAAGPLLAAAGVTWQQRVDTCVRALLGHVPHSAQYARALIEVAYARITTAINYTANPKPLKSKIVLLRAPSSHSSSLQRYSQQPISVHNLSTPLAHIVKDIRCSHIINQHLSNELLEAFYNKNLCETYFLRSDIVLSRDKY